jgi:hypothetical protein
MPEPVEVHTAEVVVQRVHERTVRSPVELDAASGQGHEAALARALAEFAEQPRLSDTRFPYHLHHPWRTGQGILDSTVEDRQLRCPPDEMTARPGSPRGRRTGQGAAIPCGGHG